MSFGHVAIEMVTVSLPIVLGWVVSRLGLMSEGFERELSRLVLDVALPALVVSSVFGATKLPGAGELLQVFFGYHGDTGQARAPVCDDRSNPLESLYFHLGHHDVSRHGRRMEGRVPWAFGLLEDAYAHCEPHRDRVHGDGLYRLGICGRFH